MLERLPELTRTPEFNVTLFALLLNLPWEFLQVPFFDGMPQAPHWESVKACARAAGGDAVIALLAFGAVALMARSREWVIRSNWRSTLAFIGCGVLITVVIERLALSGHWVSRWTYSSLMPVVPVLDVGLVPLLQWVMLPPLVLWLVRRQLAAGVPAA